MNRTISFDYEKESGGKSYRVVHTLVEPTDKYFAIDLSELDTEDQGMFIAKLEDILDERTQLIEKLMVEFDIKHKYRYFKPERMSNITIDT